MNFEKHTSRMLALLLLFAMMLSGCGKDASDRDTETETEHEHQWSEWTVEKEPTCDAEGKKVSTCACGERNVRRVDALGHTYTDGVCKVCGEPKPSEGLEFMSKGDGTCIWDGMGTCEDAELIIPAVSPAGDRVTEIYPFVLRGENQRRLTRVVIPDSVMRIGHEAFRYCSELLEVQIPDGITEIQSYTFSGCFKLDHVVLPQNCTSIDIGAFSVCSGLTEITLPAGLRSIGNYAFDDCRALTDIHYGGTMAQWEAIEKGIDWDRGTDRYTVHCTDGDIVKSES